MGIRLRRLVLPVSASSPPGRGLARGALVLVASGGIVHLVFHDIAPGAFREGHWGPTLGASLGFLVAIVGDHVVA